MADSNFCMLNDLDQLIERKRRGPPLAVLTAADYPTARLLDEAGVDMILVGDSLGMVVLGFPDTTEVTMEMMVHHTAAVCRGVKRAPVIGDLPFESYRTPEEALANARRLMAVGASAVKLEGGGELLPQVRAITGAGIPLVGHLGMLPQHVKEEGGYKKKGRNEEEAGRLVADAQALETAGVCAMVLESVIAPVAARMTEAVGVPTIGIGSGPDVDGQVLVTHDVLGSFPWFVPPFVTTRANVAGETTRAVREFLAEVRGA